jgi:hypothetical protein
VVTIERPALERSAGRCFWGTLLQRAALQLAAQVVTGSSFLLLALFSQFRFSFFRLNEDVVRATEPLLMGLPHLAIEAGV